MTVNIQPPTIEKHKTFLSYKKRPETKFLVVHCSATQPKDSYTWKTIDQMHRQRGWLGIGYHFVICTDGTIQEGRPLDVIGAHVSGHNKDSIGICLIGGVDKNSKPVDNFTEEQKESLKQLLDYLRWLYKDEVIVCGHRDFDNVKKACPCFNVKSWYSDIGAKYALFKGPIEDFKKHHKVSKIVFDEINGTDIEDGDLVRVG